MGFVSRLISAGELSYPVVRRSSWHPALFCQLEILAVSCVNCAFSLSTWRHAIKRVRSSAVDKESQPGSGKFRVPLLYPRLIRFVYTSCGGVRAAGAGLMYVTTDITLKCRWTWKLGSSSKVACNSHFVWINVVRLPICWLLEIVLKHISTKTWNF